MGLARYRQKRDFSITPEPSGTGKRSGKQLRYVIQKHAARRLHYDFRLELDGVLKSWAVPKGPSLDPADKRLAVHVEDHPLAYGSFEGVIPEKQYGAGEVIVWDQGSWEPVASSPAAALAAYRKGHLKFRLDGEKLQGNWALVRMHGRNSDDKADNWLLVKEDDEFALPGEGEKAVREQQESVLSGRTVEALKTGKKTAGKPPAKKAAPKAGLDLPHTTPVKLPERMDPQLATLVERAPGGDDWAYEVKFDGYRLLARVDRGKVTLFTRNGLDWTDRFPGIAAALSKLPAKDMWLDGEACVMDDKGISRFGALQRVLSGESRLAPLLMLFDVMHIDGRDLREAPLEQRKEALKQLLATQGDDSPLRYSDHLLATGSEAQAQACQIGLEGLIGKRLGSRYVGRRSSDWIKLKCRQRQEFVIGGYTPPGGSRSNFGALLLGVFDPPGQLRYAGRIGTGFDARTLQSLHERMLALETETSPFVSIPSEQRVRGTHWLKPELVAEVSFAEWTDDGHVRQGAFVGLREDKPAAAIGREVPKATVRKSEPQRKAAARQTKGTQIAGVTITHPERIVYPEAGISKLEVAQYYERMAARMLPYLKDRPLSLVRCPGGAQADKACFFQKHVLEDEFPGIETVLIEDSSGEKEPYVVANSAEALAGLAQMSTLELHAWGSTAAHLETPDMFVIDFDPDEGLAWHNVVDAARAAHALFDGIGLTSFLKTTGGKGLHVVVPIVPEAGWDEVKEFTRMVALRLVEAFPDRFTANISKAKRKGRIFVDYLRNGRGATAIAPYSLRARPNAPVAVPIAWDDLDRDVRGNSFTLRNMEKALAGRDDPWADYFNVRQKLTAKMKRSVGM
jgi:bifunctional non-homologous end joining protein LigD